MAGTPPRNETVTRLHDIVFDKVMSVLRGPEAAPFDLASDYFDRFNAEFEQPLRLAAEVPYSTRLLIKSNQTTAGNGAKKTTPPTDDVINFYPDTSINFNGGAVSGGGSVTMDNGGAFSLPSVTTGQFVRMAAVYQSANNAIDTHFSAASTTVSGLANPGSLFSVLDGLPIGYIDLVALGVSSFATPNGSSLIVDSVSGVSYIYRFAAGGGSGGGAITDFKVKSISGNLVNIGKGFQELADGTVLVTGLATTAAALPVNLSLNLTTILGATPAASTTYFLYVDLAALESPFTLTDSGRPVVRVYNESHFKLLTTDPYHTNPIRFLPVGLVRSAADTSWNGTGSKFATTPTLRQTLDSRFFGYAEEYDTQVSSASGSITVSHGLSGQPQLIEFYYNDGTNESGRNTSDHLLNVNSSQITFSSFGLPFTGVEVLKMKAIRIQNPGQSISVAASQPEFGWYTDTSVSSVSHNLTDASDIKGMALIEWDVTANVYRILPASSLVTNYNNTTIFFNWSGLSPSSTLQYRLVAGGRALPASIPLQFGGYTKFVGFGPGFYQTVSAAMVDAVAGDSILVNKSYTVSGEETISVSDIRICFMPGIEVIATGTGVAWRITGNRVDIDGLDLTVNTVGTMTDGLRVQGNDGNIINTRIRTNNAGTTLTNAVNIASGATRALVVASVRSDAGTITNAAVDSGTSTDSSVRS